MIPFVEAPTETEAVLTRIDSLTMLGLLVAPR